MLQDTVRSCHCCQRFHNQLVRGADYCVQHTFHVCFLFHYVTAFYFLFSSFGHFEKYSDFTELVHLCLFPKIFYVLYLQLRGANNSGQDSSFRLRFSIFRCECPEPSVHTWKNASLHLHSDQRVWLWTRNIQLPPSHKPERIQKGPTYIGPFWILS